MLAARPVLYEETTASAVDNACACYDPTPVFHYLYNKGFIKKKIYQLLYR